MVAERDELLRALDAVVRDVDPTGSVSALDAYALADPSLIHLIVETVRNLDPVSATAGAAGLGIAPKVLGRILTRLVTFAKQFRRPLTIKVGDASIDLSPDTSAKEIARIAAKFFVSKLDAGDPSRGSKGASKRAAPKPASLPTSAKTKTPRKRKESR
jgi:hypothetical protein